MEKPRPPHLHATHRVLQYLKGCPVQGLFFLMLNKSLHVKAYTDSDWAACPDSRKYRLLCLYWEFIGFMEDQEGANNL